MGHEVLPPPCSWILWGKGTIMVAVAIDLGYPPSSGKEEEEIITTTVAHSLPPPLLTIMEICPVETGGDGIVGPFYYTPYLLLPLSSAPLF